MNGHGMGIPGVVPNPKVVNQSGKALTPRDPRTTRARPRYRARVPTVTTSDGRPIRVTSTPLSRPPSAPTTSTMGMTSSIGTPAAYRVPRTAADRPTIDSTDRSISPEMMIRAIGSDMIATSMTAAIRLAKFRGVRKTGDSDAPIPISMMSTIASSVSQRASEAITPRRPPFIAVAVRQPFAATGAAGRHRARPRRG